MQLGLGSYACAWAIGGVPGYPAPERPLGAVGLIECAAQLEVRLVQIADNIPLERCSGTALKSIRSAARENGITLELGTRGIAPAHLARLIDLCAFFESRLLRVAVDTDKHQPSPGEVVSLVHEALGKLRAAGVTLAIENHDRFTASTLADIVKQTADPLVGVCLDTVNSFGALEGPEVVINTLAPYVVNVHVKDFAVRRASHQMGFEITGALAGEGQLDIPALVRQLQVGRRHPNLILELWPPPESDYSATVSKEEQWRQSSIHYLRRLVPSYA
jgi:sugar phosphate isomerase/epimerase